MRNHTLLDMVRSMMSYVDFPPFFCCYDLQATTYFLNRVLSKSIDKILYKIWNGKRPNLSYLKSWGYDAYMKHIVSEKLGVKSDNYKFVGYPKELVGYYFYDLIEQKVFVSKYVTFLEKEFVLEKSSERK